MSNLSDLYDLSDLSDLSDKVPTMTVHQKEQSLRKYLVRLLRKKHCSRSPGYVLISI